MGNLVLAIILLTIATWRLSYLLVHEDGPYSVFSTLRNVLSEMQNVHGKMLSSLFECMYCMSIWVGIFFTIAFVIDVNFALYFSLPFVFSSAAILFDIMHDRLTNNG